MKTIEIKSELIDSLNQVGNIEIVNLAEIRSGGEGEEAWTVYEYTTADGYTDLVATNNGDPDWRASDPDRFDEAYPE